MNEPQCSGCCDQLGWYSPDNGQWISCKCSGNKKVGFHIPDFTINSDEFALCDQCNEKGPSIRLSYMRICQDCIQRAQRVFDAWEMMMGEIEYKK